MRKQLLLLVMAFLGTASAQWVNYPAPGTPRTRDGKPDLTAKAPRTREGKPDLSGVWHVEPTSLAEWKRLLGPGLEEAEKTSVPGMTLDTVSKYGFNILVDFKPAESPMRPEALAILRRRAPGGPETLTATHCLPLGVPLATMLSEVSKIVQTPGLTLI